MESKVTVKQPLAEVLKTADVAVYEFDGYTVVVGDARPIRDSFKMTVAKEGLPPHITEYHNILNEEESSLDGTLSYQKGMKAWVARAGDE